MERINISIDIGTDALKILLGDWNSDKVSISQAHYFPYAFDSFTKSGGAIQFQTLKEAIEKIKLKGNAALTISDPKFGRHFISLSNVNSDPRNALKTEMEQKKWYQSTKDTFDYIKINSKFSPAEKSVSFIAFQVENEKIRQFVDLLKENKINVVAVDSSALCLSRFLAVGRQVKSDEFDLLLDFGAAQTNFYVINQGQIVFERRLKIGGTMLTKSIVNYSKVDPDNAISMKKEYGLDMEVLSDKIVDATYILTSTLEKLVADIQYSMKYFFFQVSRSKVSQFKAVFLTGGGALMPGLEKFIQERLDTECKQVSFESAVKKPSNLSMENNEFFCYFHKALGLGKWRGNSEHYDEVQLLPDDLLPRKKSKSVKGITSLTRKSSAIFFLCLLVAFFAFKYNNMKAIYLDLKDREAQVINQIKDLKESSVALDKEGEVTLKLKKELISKLNFEKSQLWLIQEHLSHHFHLAPTLSVITRHFPVESGVLNSIKVLENTVRIQGEVKSNQVISQYMKKMEESPLIENCDFVFSKRNQDSEESLILFEIKFGLKK